MNRFHSIIERLEYSMCNASYFFDSRAPVQWDRGAACPPSWLDPRSLIEWRPEACLVRLDVMSQASHVRRSITSEQSFQTAINVFAHVSWDVCKLKCCYKSTVHLQKNVYSTLLPEEFVALGTIGTCSRCNNDIRKRKIPPTAYWNKIMPAEILPKLANLMSVEERFLCRIVPVFEDYQTY